MSNILVTGGSGFVGSHLVDALLRAGHRVRIFDMVLPTWRTAFNGSLSLYIGSVLDFEALRMSLSGIDAVYHLAAVADVDDVYRDPLRAESINVRGTLNVLEAARQTGIKRIVYASSIWVYAPSTRYEVDETEPILPPANLYSATKIAGEHYCESYHQMYGMETTILRYGIPYGPRIRDTAVTAVFVRKALNHEPLTVAGSGEQFRQFLYVEDLAEANALVLEKDTVGRVYNIVGNERITVKDIALEVFQSIGNVTIKYTDARISDFSGKIVSGAKAERSLGWTPKTSFKEGLQKYIQWYREHDRAPKL